MLRITNVKVSPAWANPRLTLSPTCDVRLSNPKMPVETPLICKPSTFSKLAEFLAKNAMTSPVNAAVKLYVAGLTVPGFGYGIESARALVPKQQTNRDAPAIPPKSAPTEVFDVMNCLDKMATRRIRHISTLLQSAIRVRKRGRDRFFTGAFAPQRLKPGALSSAQPIRAQADRLDP